MSLRISEIAIDCHDPAALAGFWSAALGYPVVDSEDDLVEIGPWLAEPADLADQMRRAPVVPTLIFVRVPESKVVKNRLHLDLRPTGDQDVEVERLIRLGARRVDVGQGEATWVVLADPEGNEFCVLGPLPL